MHRWPAYLAALPASLLRLVAAANRVSLPRKSTPAERLARVRGSLCRPAAVRERYFALPPEEQSAAQALRCAPRTLSHAQVAALLGPVRPLAELRRDRAPRSIAERFLLQGWLLPRPTSRHHPARFVVPPELRAWLPRPLPPPPQETVVSGAGTHAAAVPPPVPLAVRAATAVLAAAAHTPLPLRRDGRPTAAALRRLRPLLAPLAAEAADALIVWVTPLLADLGLLAPHGAAATPAPAASPFLARPAAERLAVLRAAWERSPRPEPALLPPRASRQGVDWPALRRRLLRWAEALAAEPSADPAASFAALAAAFGPLADPYTHPFRRHRRPPWNRRTARDVWFCALQGPLDWLGVHPVWPGATTAAPRWSADDERVHIPHAAAGEALLVVAPFASDLTAEDEGLTVYLATGGIARGTARGHDPARLRATLERQVGSLPSVLAEQIAPAGRVRLLQRTILLEDAPGALDGALGTGAVRRSLEEVVAPGIALVAPGREVALARQLARYGHLLPAPLPTPAPTPVPGLSAGEVTSLLLAGACYSAFAPPDAPPGPAPALLNRLRAALSPALSAATEAVIARHAPPRASEREAGQGEADASHHHGRPTDAALLVVVREALRRRAPLALLYRGADEVAPRRRTIRPLRLERHGDHWYVHAYCLLVRGERCFRLDRILHLDAATIPASAAARRQPRGLRRRTSGRSVTTVGFFAPPAAPPSGSPLVRVWLDDGLDQPVGGLGGDPADAKDRDPLHGRSVEPVAAHTVGVEIDQPPQLAPDSGELGLVQQALKDAVLDPRAVALEQLHHLGAAFILDDVVADDREHSALPAHAGV
jgi:hypothetical protein